MAQIKLELEKEIYIPYKVIVSMEEEPAYNHNNQLWKDDDDYYNYGQHWQKKGF